MKALIFIIGFASSSMAQIVLPANMLLDGVEYRDVVYKSHDAAKLRFTHSDGMASVDISKLSPAMQSALGYNSEEAAAITAAQAAEKLATLQAVQAKKEAAAASVVNQSNHATVQPSEADLKAAAIKRLSELEQKTLEL